MNKVAMSFRVDETLRNRFIETCKREDIPASVVIREFMKNFIERKTGDDEVIFNYDLNRMKDRVENQAFVTVPTEATKDVKAFEAWLKGL